VKISVQSGTAAPVSLTGISPEEWVEGLAGPCDWADQVNRLIGGAQVRVADRGNVQNTLTFRIRRTHASPNVAALFYVDHPGAVPHVATVTFTIVNLSGISVATRSMTSAAIKVSRESWHGCSTVMTYHIQGGRIS
jgi:hypothetical protein